MAPRVKSWFWPTCGVKYWRRCRRPEVTKVRSGPAFTQPTWKISKEYKYIYRWKRKTILPSPNQPGELSAGKTNSEHSNMLNQSHMLWIKRCQCHTLPSASLWLTLAGSQPSRGLTSSPARRECCFPGVSGTTYLSMILVWAMVWRQLFLLPVSLSWFTSH